MRCEREQKQREYGERAERKKRKKRLHGQSNGRVCSRYVKFLVKKDLVSPLQAGLGLIFSLRGLLKVELVRSCFLEHFLLVALLYVIFSSGF